ncbi:MAG: hypothetical protein HFJ50_08000 [Clostridia bacterium]|jgi:hypothetical protein|nr:hypothetical protein [Clostridia bacterium]
MQISVNLQSYILSPIVYLVLVILALLGLTIYFLNYEEKKKLVGTSKIEIKEVEERDRKSIIKRYLKKIDKLTKKVESEKIELRIEYQNLSKIIRNFVYEMTDIKVQNYSLQEIKETDIKELYELVEEYYVPEFAEMSNSDIKASIEKTRKVIEKWN